VIYERVTLNEGAYRLALLIFLIIFSACMYLDSKRKMSFSGISVGRQAK